jgi:hypothetical protein
MLHLTLLEGSMERPLCQRDLEEKRLSSRESEGWPEGRNEEEELTSMHGPEIV